MAASAATPVKLDRSRLSLRDIAVATYENGVKSNYLLLAILGAIIGRPLVGSPPIVVISFLIALAADIFAVLVLLKTWRNTKWYTKLAILTLFILQAYGFVNTLILDLEISSNPLIVSIRLLLALTVLAWAIRKPLISRTTITE